MRPHLESYDGNGGNREVWKWTRRAGYAIASVAALAILATSPYAVGPSDVAIVQRYGSYNRTEQPGFRFQLPWPIESRHKISTREIQRLELGYRTTGKVDQKTGKPIYENHPEEVTMMTSDENLAIVEFSMQYEIKDPFAFSFNVKDPKNILHDISQAAMRRIVAQKDVDYVLLAGKPEMQVNAKNDIQEIVDLYDMGIKILTVQLGDVRAPPQVKEAFDDVQKAAENREQTINDARTYANKILPEARGNAFKQEQDAFAYRERTVNQARGDADRFLAIWERYKAAPDITSRQLYLQQMQEILPKFKKVIVDADVPITIFREQGGR